ncbi:hypothetical protein TNCV_4703521 [Trichonephila clavipes]|nr:hypothetical protein TNCV_4703521 [Trichonephila clavipes]
MWLSGHTQGREPEAGVAKSWISVLLQLEASREEELKHIKSVAALSPLTLALEVWRVGCYLRCHPCPVIHIGIYRGKHGCDEIIDETLVNTVPLLRSAIYTFRTVSKDSDHTECVVRMSPKYTVSDLGQENMLAAPYAVLFQLQESSPRDDL